MPHSYTRVWLHVVFSTKDRKPLIKSTIEKKIFDHMRQQLVEIGCPVRIINGMSDHVHLLFLQNPKMSVADIIKQVKGNTSHWINAGDLIVNKFAWQTGYGAFSVSESQIDKTFRYIQDQKIHHQHKILADEFDELLTIHGLEKQANGETKESENPKNQLHQIKVPWKFSEFLLSRPESGMGYQLVKVILKSGQVLNKHKVINASILLLENNEIIEPADIAQILPDN